MAYLGTALPSEEEVRRATAHWGASAGTAQALLLHCLVNDWWPQPRDAATDRATAVH
jgi:hypothetical protein